MPEATDLRDVLEAAGRLSDDQQEVLLETLKMRLLERRRQRVGEDVRQARRQYRQGKTRLLSVDELMSQILEDAPEDTA